MRHRHNLQGRITDLVYVTYMQCLINHSQSSYSAQPIVKLETWQSITQKGNYHGCALARFLCLERS